MIKLETLLKELEEKALALSEQISTLDIPLKESKAAEDELMEFFADPENPIFAEKYKKGDLPELFEKAKKAQLASELSGYITTLNSELVLLDEKTTYVITDGDLISPAGFHPDQRVFIKNEVFIQTNKLPRSISSNLYAYEIKEAA